MPCVISRNYLILFYIILSSCLWHNTEQASIRIDLPYYTAGVVEFLRNTDDVSFNAQGFIDIINSPEAEATDIIIFPESTLNDNFSPTFVPDPVDKIAPCNYMNFTKYEMFFMNISCAARNASKYIIINLTEQDNCIVNDLLDPRPCASDGLNMFNTNVAFDRNGVVVGRYRKVNLYGEPKNTTYLPDYSIFETDFDVRFGMFTCFDLLFHTPAQELVEKHGITDFVFPSMWFSQLPFLTAVQAQFGWAYANDVNFLAAGASEPSRGNTGSGIYAGRNGPLAAVMSLHEGLRSILIAQVPKIINGKRQEINKQQIEELPKFNSEGLNSEQFQMKQDTVASYASILIDFNNSNSLNYTLCYNETFCCNFDLKWQHLNASSDSNYYTYRLGAYNNWRHEHDPNMETNVLKNCAIFSCIGNDISDCGKLFPAATKLEPKIAFERVVIEATYPDSRQFIYMPNTLLDDLTPVPVDKFVFDVLQNEDKTNHVQLILNATIDNLMTFAIYGNYYKSCETLGCPQKDVGALTQFVSIFTILIALIFSFICS